MEQEWKVRGMEQNDKNYCQHTLQAIWALGLMGKLVCFRNVWQIRIMGLI
jgi:hypothetical protein